MKVLSLLGLLGTWVICQSGCVHPVSDQHTHDPMIGSSRFAVSNIRWSDPEPDYSALKMRFGVVDFNSLDSRAGFNLVFNPGTQGSSHFVSYQVLNGFNVYDLVPASLVSDFDGRLGFDIHFESQLVLKRDRSAAVQFIEKIVHSPENLPQEIRNFGDYLSEHLSWEALAVADKGSSDAYHKVVIGDFDFYIRGKDLSSSIPY